MYDYFEILGEIQLLPDGAMHWIVGCWPSKASRDAGDPASLVNDFVSNANQLIGAPRRALSTRTRPNGAVQYQLAAGGWIDRDVWHNDYPVLDADGNLVTARPERVWNDLPPVSALWAARDILQQMRAWLRKAGNKTGDESSQALVFGQRAQNTLPVGIRVLDNTGYTDSLLGAFTSRTDVSV